MKRKLIAFSMSMALLLSVFSAANVGAFTATIEGPTNTPSRAEWDFAKQPDLAGEGIIQRNATQQGAFVFNDATGDQRVVTQNAVRITDKITREADLDWFSVTADANNVYFMAKTDYYRGIQNNPALELIITVDINHTSGVGSLALPNTQTFSTTNVPADAAWEFAVDAKFAPGSPTSPGFVTTLPKIYTTPIASNTCNSCAAQLASAAINAGSFAEIKVPWLQLGGKPIGTNFLRFTVATMYSTHEVPPDGYNSPVIDVLGSGSTLADIQDGTLGTSFDVHFDTNGAVPTYEPYAPLMVTEFQPDPTGKDDPAAASNADSEWIEVYNPNTFAITDLNNYKVGNAAKRGSGEGMFKFKATNIPAKGVVLVARSKAKFLAAHPGYVGTVYDLSSDMTQYSAWSTGTTIDLANGPSGTATTFEEQVMILDAKDDIVDMATYGNTATPYPGHTDFPVSATTPETSYERCPASRDTNNSSVDFSFHGLFSDETPGVVCDGVPGLDLTVAKTGPSNPTKDDTTGARTVNYTINYSNIGTSGEAGTVTVVDTLPAGLTFTNTAEFASPQPNSVVGQNLTWTFAGLPAATSGTIVLTATVDSSVGQNVPLTNNVTINGPSEQAAAKNNNSASWTTTTLGPADTNVSTNLSGAVPPGAQFQFTINYQNTGQDDATDTTITDVLPGGVTILSQDSPGATWDGATTGTVTWNVGTLAPNESGTIVVTAQLASATPVGSTLTNAVDITVPVNDPTPANNAESVNLTVGLRKLYVPIQLR
jgi:uncharacterized repeat protein (TIGR01451 family)/fimbrial isopeptide formation D2 family protein